MQVADVQNPKSPFQLLGRLDRIVKLEEKRLSLDAIEAKIAEIQSTSDFSEEDAKELKTILQHILEYHVRCEEHRRTAPF